MTFALLKKSFSELRSDPLLVLLTLLSRHRALEILAFVLLYKLIFLEGMTVYDVLILAQPSTITGRSLPEDAGSGLPPPAELVDALDAIEYPGGGRLFRLRLVDSYDEGIRILENRDARIMAIVSDSGPPERGAPGDGAATMTVTLVGDHSDPYYVLASRLFRTALEDYLVQTGRASRPITITEEPLGISREKTEFENYVPGLVVFSTLVLIYLLVLLLAREGDSRVFVRYRLSRVPARVYVAAYTILFMILSLAAALLALSAAFALGFRSPVSVLHDLVASLAVCAILGLAAAGTAFAVAGLARSSVQAFQIATFPFMILVFFSGSVYPFPKIVIGELANRPIGLFDLLPATHAVAALHKILTFGTSIGDLAYELIGLSVTSALFFLAGATLFALRKLPRTRLLRGVNRPTERLGADPIR